MKSISNYSNTIIDMRYLTLGGTFILPSEEMSDNLCKELYDFWENQFAKICILDWDLNDKKFNKIGDALKRYKLKNKAYILYMRGSIITEAIKNKTSFRKYEHLLMYPPFPINDIKISSESADRLQDNEIQNNYKNDSAKYKESLLELFNLEGKVPVGYTIQPDTMASITCMPIEGSDYFCGKFSLSVASYCLEEEIETYSNRFRDFICQELSKYPNLNAFVKLDHDPSSYTNVFGEMPKYKDNNCIYPKLKMYCRYAYIMEIGWINYISCETSRLGLMNNRVEGIQFEELSEGGIVVSGCTPITNQTIHDLCSMKAIMYRVMMPRKITHGYHTVFRKFWESIPVFDNEITVNDSGIHFAHNGTINEEFVRESVGLR